MTQEEKKKAKRYDEAIERARALNNGEDVDVEVGTTICEYIFPELKESEDERLRKTTIAFLKDFAEQGYENAVECIDWLEKQGEKELVNFDEAEKEKTDFVGDGFIECHADFLDFKEGNTYWLEYIGDDKYNVRSDNLLGKTYHITPCQLYTVFKKLTWLEKQSKNSIYNVPSREVILAIWDLGNEWKELTNGCISTKYGNQLNYIQKHWEESEYYLREKQSEQKSIDKIEPKFHEGDWVIHGHNILKIRYVGNEYYCIETVGGYVDNMLISEIDSLYHIWTIQDAKDGDVLTCNEEILLFKSYSVQGRISLYCWYNGQTNNFHSKEVDTLLTTRNKICPATKEQRDLLFQKMKEAGYKWDSDKVAPKFHKGDWL